MGTERVESRRSPFKRLVPRWCQAGPKVLGTRRICSGPSHYWPHGLGLQQSVPSSLHALSNPPVYGGKFLRAQSKLWRSGRGGKLLLFSPYIPHWPRNSTPILSRHHCPRDAMRLPSACATSVPFRARYQFSRGFFSPGRKRLYLEVSWRFFSF